MTKVEINVGKELCTRTKLITSKYGVWLFFCILLFIVFPFGLSFYLALKDDTQCNSDSQKTSVQLVDWKHEFCKVDFSKSVNISTILSTFGLELAIIGFPLACVGLAITFYGAEQSTQAETKAQTIIEALEKSNQILNNYSEDFLDIYKNHLLELLKEVQSPDIIEEIDRTNIYLALSTPAYGRPVFNESQQKHFQDLITEIDKINSSPKIKLNLVLFSPDHHVYHLINTLIWSSFPNANTKAEDFRDGIESVMGIFQGAPKKENTTQIWICGESNIRVFGYWQENKKKGKCYLVLTEQVTIPVALDYFNAQSIPIPANLVQSILVSEKGIMSKLQRSYYKKDDSKLDLNRKTIEELKNDYMYGRTDKFVFNFKVFHDEMISFIEKYKLRITGDDKTNLNSDENIIKRAILCSLTYFQHVIVSEQKSQANLIQEISISAALYLIAKYNLFTSLDNVVYIEIFESNEEINSFMKRINSGMSSDENTMNSAWNDIFNNKTNGNSVSSFIGTLTSQNDKQKQLIRTKIEDLQNAYLEQEIKLETDNHSQELVVADLKMTIFILYSILSSGFGVSEYSKSVKG